MRISVLMSAYREREDHLRAAIDSILHQTYGEFEFVILLDDPQNAALRSVIEEYAARDARIRFFVNPRNLGLAASLNRGLALCRGELVARMDADDVSLPTRFERELAYLAAHPECRVVSVNIISIDEAGEVISRGAPVADTPSTVARALRIYNAYSHPGAMYDRRTVLSVGGYREIRYAEDYDLWLRLLDAGVALGCIDEHLLYYRLSASGVSRKFGLMQWYACRYCHRLARLRRRGRDVCSPADQERYFATRRVTEAGAERYALGMAHLDEANTWLSQRQLLRGGMRLLRAFFTHPEIFPVFTRVLRYKLTVRRA